MIKYPNLKDYYTIGITAPSSGVEAELHNYISSVKNKFEKNHRVIIGETTFTQHKAKSAPVGVRAREFNNYLQSNDIDIIIPPWGGELAIEILDQIEYESMQKKWVLGYSDISAILLAITLKTGLATAHGTNIVDLRGSHSDETTSKWESVLKTNRSETVVQYSSNEYQSKWDHDKNSDYVFYFDKKTKWKSICYNNIKIEGRLLGGCIDVIHHLIGTPYGNVQKFSETFIKDEPLVWYLENCDLSPTDFRRCLVQMKYAGWFENCNGILFGRTMVDYDTEGYTIEDVYEDITEDLKIPVIYDIDCGHQPPQITFINGAYGEIEYKNGEGIVTQKFI